MHNDGIMTVSQPHLRNRRNNDNAGPSGAGLSVERWQFKGMCQYLVGLLSEGLLLVTQLLKWIQKL